MVSLEEFQAKLKNRNLERYSVDVYKALLAASFIDDLRRQKCHFESSISDLLEDALFFLNTIKQILDGTYVNKKRDFQNSTVKGMIVKDYELAYIFTRDLFLDKILNDNYVNNFGINIEFSLPIDGERLYKPIQTILIADQDEQKIPDIFPDANVPITKFRIFGDGYNLDLNIHIEAVEHYLEASRKKSKYFSHFIDDFFAELLKIGIPMKNKYFVEIYDCLELVGKINEEIIEYHTKKAQDKYCKESYIRSKFGRLKKRIEKGQYSFSPIRFCVEK